MLPGETSILLSLRSLCSVFKVRRFGESFPFGKWWAQVDSNHRPRAYQARALTT